MTFHLEAASVSLTPVVGSKGRMGMGSSPLHSLLLISCFSPDPFSKWLMTTHIPTWLGGGRRSSYGEIVFLKYSST